MIVMFTPLASYICLVLAIEKTGSFLQIFTRTATVYKSHHAPFHNTSKCKESYFFKDNKFSSFNVKT